ncbi:MAG TPA: hypothetical protein VHP63_00470 [candidate division Zixibacteria bacterium]|nr:hypothetical protein [candidate division Zixibacteria bacterium]
MKLSFPTPAAVLLCAFLLIASRPLMAQTDALFIDANGRVGVTASGQAITDGSYTLVLSIWDDTSAGNMLWSETHLVQTKDGLWNATLGSLTPLPIDVMAPSSSDSLEPRFLQMQFDGEVIQPRRRMGGLPYAGAAQRLRGDINTAPGRIQVAAGDASESDYEFNIKNSNDSGTVVEVKKPKGKGSNPSMDGVVILYSSLPGGQGMSMDLLDGDSGITIEHRVGPDSTGDILGSLGFYETTEDAVRAKSSKPKEIVVVGSKVTEKKSYYHDHVFQNNQSDYEFITGHVSGKRTYSPLHITSAVLPDSIPGYSMTVDSNGTEMQMAKNNNDGSSCWIRVAQQATGTSLDLNAADNFYATVASQKATPKLYEAACKGTHLASSDSANLNVFLSPDSGYGHNVSVNSLTSGMHSTTEVDGRDFLIWQRNSSPASSDSVSNYQFLSVDSGFGKSLYLTNGTSTTESVDAADYVVWRKSNGTYNASGDTAKIQAALSADSGYVEDINASSGSSSAKRVTKIDAFTIKQSMHSSSPAASSEMILETSEDNSSLRISNLGGDRHQTQYVDDTSEAFEIYQNVIARAKVEKIVMKHTPLAGSRLYVGNLGWTSSDGLRVNADLVGGTKVGINVGTPTSTLDVNGTLEIGNGTPISQVLSGTATLDFPSTGGAGGTSDLSISLAGAALGDVVSLGVPAGSVTTQGMFTAWVSTANVVTVRFANLASSLQNPASGTFRAMVTKF